VIDCEMGSIVVGGMRIRDHERLGLLTVAEILAKSSDVGAIKIGMRLGEERLDRYIRAYGFGSPTGIELPGESRGLAKPLKKWSKVSIGAISMGQEIGITALQAASMVSTIANDGVWSAPRVVAGVTPPHSGPQTITFQPAGQRRVISQLTAVEMKKMMEGVVLFGTGRRAILDGYTSAGKTGTAQKVDVKTRRYSASKYIASFIGFAPVREPAITVAVILDSPVGLHQGGQVSAPVFRRVAQQALEHLRVAHDAELKNHNRLQLRAEARDEDLVETSLDHPGAMLAPNEQEPALDPGSVGTASTGTPAGGYTMLPPLPADPHSKDKMALAPLVAQAAGPRLHPGASGLLAGDSVSGTVLDVDAVTVPVLVGQSMRGAMEAAQEVGLVLDAQGSGIAREQAPLPGTQLPRGSHVAVRFVR
jgi:cell division protein FtsI (penicillin-binding protein 3)